MNTISTQILDNLYYMGVNDRETPLFENMWPLPEGVAYNSYLIVDEKTALMDTVKITKLDGFMQTLEDLLDGRKLDYLVIHHMEPDHSGCIKTVLQHHPDITIVCNAKAKEMLADYYDIKDIDFLIVKNNDILELGKRKLTFVNTPMVHWPESMVSYEMTDKVLFSQDIFGGFGTVDGRIFDDEMNYKVLRDETRRYYSNIVGKYSKQALKSLKVVEGLDINVICPVHGLVWRNNPKTIIQEYIKWASQETEEGVVIVYGSMYGNTEKMADILARLLAEEGVKNIKVFDCSKTHASYILSEIWKYNGFVLGSCTYNNSVYPNMYNLMNILDMNKLSDRVLGIFGSYGWSGGAVKDIKAFADKGKYTLPETVVECKGSIKIEDFENLKKLAKEIAELIKK